MMDAESVAIRRRAYRPDKSYWAASRIWGFFIMLGGAICLLAQTPFQFRDTDPLQGLFYPAHDVAFANPFVKKMAGYNPWRSFGDGPWLYEAHDTLSAELRSIVPLRQVGELEEAANRELRLIAAVRKTQGDNASDVSFLLDDLAEFYLYCRFFDRAYSTFEDALRVRRVALHRLDNLSGEFGTNNPALVAKEVEAVIGWKEVSRGPGAILIWPEVQAGRNPVALRKYVIRSQTISWLHVADLLTRLGQLELARGDWRAATQRLSEASQINHQHEYLCYVNRLEPIYFQSVILERQGKWGYAAKLWEDAVSFRAGLHCAPYLDALTEQAAFHARQGDFRSAAASASRIVSADRKGFAPAVELPSWLDTRVEAHSYSYALGAMNNIMAAERWIEERGRSGSVPQLVSWGRNIFRLDSTSSGDQVDRVYENVRLSRGKYLFSEAEVHRLSTSTPDQFSNVGLFDRLAKVRADRASIYVSTARGRAPFDWPAAAALDNVERLIIQTLSAPPKPAMIDQLSNQALGQTIPDDVVLLDFIVWNAFDQNAHALARTEYGVFVVTRDQPVEYRALGLAGPIDRQIDNLGLQLREFGENRRYKNEMYGPAANNTGKVRQTLRDLYLKVLHPVEHRFAGKKRLLIVPDGKLALAPVAAFINSEGRYLIDQVTVSYLNSWRDLYESRSRTPSTTPVIVGDPDFDAVLQSGALFESDRAPLNRLNGAKEEVREVAGLLGVGSDHVLTGAEASEFRLKQIVGPRILHLATHASRLEVAMPPDTYDLAEFPSVLVMDHPLLGSAIALAGANRRQSGSEDGWLTGLEAASLKLVGTQLVVISACSRKPGEIVDGQGTLGFRAAFSLAGAEALVMSLWSVDDAVGLSLMKDFYHHLAEGEGRAESLRLAQQKVKEEFEHPFYWASYTLSGDFTPMEGKRRVPFEMKKEVVSMTPRCFEISGPSPYSLSGGRARLRIEVSGPVARSQDRPEVAVYDLQSPGSRATLSVDGMPQKKIPQVDRFSIRVMRDKDFNSIQLHMTSGAPLLMLTGPSSLFPTLDVPQNLPSISAFNPERSLFHLANGYSKVDKIENCSMSH